MAVASTLADPSCKTAGCPFSSGVNPGSCSASAGTLMYSEIRGIVANGATVVGHKDAGVTIVTWDENQWVSYDNNDTLMIKVDYANSKCFGGVVVRHRLSFLPAQSRREQDSKTPFLADVIEQVVLSRSRVEA